MGNYIERTTQASATKYYVHDLSSTYNLVLLDVVSRGRFLKSVRCKHDEGLLLVKVYFKRVDESIDLKVIHLWPWLAAARRRPTNPLVTSVRFGSGRDFDPLVTSIRFGSGHSSPSPVTRRSSMEGTTRRRGPWGVVVAGATPRAEGLPARVTTLPHNQREEGEARRCPPRGDQCREA